MQSYELKLSDGNMEVIEKEQGQLPPFSIRQVGNYLVVDTDVSLVLLWDKGTSIFLRLSPEFKVRPCPGRTPPSPQTKCRPETGVRVGERQREMVEKQRDTER